MKKPQKVDRVSNTSVKKAYRKPASITKTPHGTLGLLSKLDLSKNLSPQSGLTKLKSIQSNRDVYTFQEGQYKSRQPESILKVALPSITSRVALKSYNTQIQQTVNGIHETIRDRFANLDDLKHSGSLGQSYVIPQHRTSSIRSDHQASMIAPFGRLTPNNRHSHARRFSTIPRNTNPMDEDPWDDYRTDGESYIVLDEDFVREFDARIKSNDQRSTTPGARQKKSHSHGRKKHDNADSPHVGSLDSTVIKSMQDEPKVAPLHAKIGKTVNTDEVPTDLHRAHHFIEYSAVSVVPKTDNRASTDTEKVFPHHSMLAGTSNTNRLASMYGSGYLHKRLFDPKEADQYAVNKDKHERSTEKNELKKKKRAQNTQSAGDTSYSMHGKRHMSSWAHLWNGVRNFSIMNRDSSQDESNPNERMLNRSINKHTRTTKAHINFEQRQILPDQLELPQPHSGQTTSVEYGYSGFDPSQLVSAARNTDLSRQRGRGITSQGKSTLDHYQHQATSRTATQDKPRFRPKVQGREWD